MSYRRGGRRTDTFAILCIRHTLFGRRASSVFCVLSTCLWPCSSGGDRFTEEGDESHALMAHYYVVCAAYCPRAVPPPPFFFLLLLLLLSLVLTALYLPCSSIHLYILVCVSIVHFTNTPNHTYLHGSSSRTTLPLDSLRTMHAEAYICTRTM